MGKETSETMVLESKVTEMTIERAAQILRKHNQWRRCDHEPCGPPYTAKEICDAIDVAVKLLERSVCKADIESIISAVTRETGVTEEEMCGRGRAREYVDARSIVSWLTYHYANKTLSHIGGRLGRTHAAILRYNEIVDSWLDEPRINLEGARITTKLIMEIEDGDKEDTDNLSCTT